MFLAGIDILPLSLQYGPGEGSRDRWVPREMQVEVNGDLLLGLPPLYHWEVANDLILNTA